MDQDKNGNGLLLRHCPNLIRRLASNTRILRPRYIKHIKFLNNYKLIPFTPGPIILKLLCGADLLESFSVPGLWKTDDILRIVQDYGIVVITREGSNPEEYIQNSSTLRELTEHIHIVQDWISNDGKNEKVINKMILTLVSDLYRS